MSRILIVDDSVDDQDVMREFLSANGITYAVASSGEEALLALDNEKFDLVITDYHMKNGDGVWLIEKLKKNHQAPRCILVTGEFTLGPEYFLSIGAAGFCYKPIIWSKLKSEIDRLI